MQCETFGRSIPFQKNINEFSLWFTELETIVISQVFRDFQTTTPIVILAWSVAKTSPTVADRASPVVVLWLMLQLLLMCCHWCWFEEPPSFFERCSGHHHKYISYKLEATWLISLWTDSWKASHLMVLAKVSALHFFLVQSNRGVRISANFHYYGCWTWKKTPSWLVLLLLVPSFLGVTTMVHSRYDLCYTSPSITQFVCSSNDRTHPTSCFSFSS